MKNSIRKAKRGGFKALIGTVDTDVWGTGFRWAMDKISRSQNAKLEPNEVLEIAAELFPCYSKITWPKIEISDEIRPITEAELNLALDCIKPSKSPGPDGIPGEVVKLLGKTYNELLRNMMNSYLLEGIIPEKWKYAQLVLLEKPKKPNQPQTYRPICLLNVMGKVFENLIRNRIRKEIGIPISRNQFGFRPGLSTIEAVAKVMEIAKLAKNKQKLCLMITIDIKNAFNSAPWDKIIESLRRKEVPKYLIRIIQSYLSDRTLLVEGERKELTCGVPQGSVLGPELWNVFYESVLDSQPAPDTELVAYADDLAIIITAKTKDLLEATANLAIQNIIAEIRNLGLSIEVTKTEAVLLTQGRGVREASVNVENFTIETSEAIKYLGIWLDKGLRMKRHIVESSTKGEKCALALARIMPNRGGASSTNRKILSTVVYSKMLYGIPVWHTEALKKSNLALLVKAARKAMLRVCSGYRTASTKAIEVITRSPPIQLKIAQAVSTYNGMDRKQAEKTTYDNWQHAWENIDKEKGKWTRILIPHVETWCKREHGEVNFYFTQFLSGHGCFGSYLKRFKIKDSDLCVFCGEKDTPEHTFFHCPKWKNDRHAIADLKPESIVSFMMSSPQNWDRVDNFVRAILIAKEQ